MEGGCTFLSVWTKTCFQKVRGPFFFLQFGVDHSYSLYWICYNVVSVLCFGFLAARHVRAQLPDQGLNLPRLALEGEVPTTGPSGKSRDDSSTVSLWLSRKQKLEGVRLEPSFCSLSVLWSRGVGAPHRLPQWSLGWRKQSEREASGCDAGQDTANINLGKPNSFSDESKKMTSTASSRYTKGSKRWEIGVKFTNTWRVLTRKNFAR